MSNGFVKSHGVEMSFSLYLELIPFIFFKAQVILSGNGLSSPAHLLENPAFIASSQIFKSSPTPDQEGFISVTSASPGKAPDISPAMS